MKKSRIWSKTCANITRQDFVSLVIIAETSMFMKFVKLQMIVENMIVQRDTQKCARDLRTSEIAG